MATKVKLDLTVLDGNAFFLIGTFRKVARRQGWTDSEIKAVTDDAMSGNYDHVLQVLIANTESPGVEGDEDAPQV